MSGNANPLQYGGRYFSTTDDLENMGSRGWTKGHHGQLPQIRATTAGGRAVLGQLTNKPQEIAMHPSKQCIVNKDYGDLRQVTEAIQPIQLTHNKMNHQVHEEAVDLSCHEMDASLDHGSFEDRLQQNSINMEFHDSPILLDVSSSDDVTQDECDVDEAENDLTDRTDKLLSMAEYREEIYHHLRKAELTHRPKPNYMRRQTDITSNMRSILVDWLVEVADEYKLHRETLFLAVDYIDRFLSVMAVQRQKLQLVGTAAMFIAAKYEEIYPPEVGEFVFITDDTYTKQQVLRMENLILRMLSFDVAVPTVHLFCERFLKEHKADAKTASLAMYLTELSLVDGDTYLQYLPSITACAAICLARHTFGEEPWPHTLVELTKYGASEFENCMRDLLVTFSGASSHSQQAIQEKYRQSKYHEVSLIQPPQSLPRPQC